MHLAQQQLHLGLHLLKALLPKAAAGVIHLAHCHNNALDAQRVRSKQLHARAAWRWMLWGAGAVGWGVGGGGAFAGDAILEVSALTADDNKRSVSHAHAGNAHERAGAMAGRVDQADLLLVAVEAPQLGRDGVKALALVFGLVGYPGEAARGLPSGVGCSLDGVERVLLHAVGELQHGAHSRRLAALRVTDDYKADVMLRVRRRCA